MRYATVLQPHGAESNLIQNLFRDGYAAWALLVVQGEGLDLYFNKRKLNKMLPPRFSVIRASVKKLKWQMSLMALGESKYVDGVFYLWVFCSWN